jgi:hypothetical protein
MGMPKNFKARSMGPHYHSSGYHRFYHVSCEF